MSGAAPGPPPPRVHQVQALIRDLRRRYAAAPVLGVRTSGDWAGGPEIEVDGARLAVLRTDSPLEVRERLARTSGDTVVLLTRLDESELGSDVVASLARQRLFSVDVWQLAMELFRARRVDPRLTGDRWIAELLLDVVPPGEAPASASGVLDFETAWSILLRRTLSLSGATFDLRELVEWAADAANVGRFRSCRVELHAGLRRLAEEKAGPAAGLVLGCLEGAHAERVVSIGLACRALFSARDEHAAAAAAAAVRLEALVGGRTVAPEAGRAWAEAAEAAIDALTARDDVARARGLVDDADRLLGELKAEDLARYSRFLTRGLAQRLDDFGRRVEAALADPGEADVARLADAARAVCEHRDASGADPRGRAASLAVRLVRWLAREDAPKGEAAVPAEPISLAEAASRYASDGGFVDRARGALRVAAVEARFTRALSALGAEVTARREHENERFGRILAAWSASPTKSPSLLPIEMVLDIVVAPIAGLRPVLVAVFDGLGFPIFWELLEGVRALGWTELARAGQKALPAVISVVPSITGFARTSLLSGRLCRGGAEIEKKGFAEHVALVAASSARRPPILFHKGEVLASPGAGLAAPLVDALADPSRRVVGVVVNAVDDRLAASDQLEPRWTVDDVRPLRGLLELARDAGRVVVLASDHGHVVEAGTKAREGAEGERWRSPSWPPEQGEVLVEGPRVLPPLGGSVVVPWSERVRYGAKKAGYHGGATPQEMIVPLAVLAPGALELEGWVELPPIAPEWWLEEGDGGGVTAAVPTPRAPVPARPRRPRAAADRQPDLFGGADEQVAAKAASPTAPAAAWLDELLASEAWVQQMRLVSRQAISAERARAVLGFLDQRGGRATRAGLARHLELPEIRVSGLVAALRRVLNVDGYDVLALDEASDTVVLNVELLRVQFGL